MNLTTVTLTSGVPTAGDGTVSTLDNISNLTLGGISGTVAVSGTFWQTTQPISAASLPLPTGAAKETGGNLASLVTNIGTLAYDGSGYLEVNVKTAPTIAVTGTFYQATQPISGTVTVVGDAANGTAVAGNPVLMGGSDGTDARTISTNSSGQQVIVGAGTAGSGSGGVLSVQGIASGTALPISAASLPLPTGAALETGGNLATIAGAITSAVVQANLKQVNGITTLAGAGATGTGAQRVTVSQDTTTIAGSAPGTAGSASSNVVTVQGVASMTPVQVSQATAASLNATVVGTGTFATQASSTPATSAMVSGTASATGTSSTSLVGAVTSKSLWITAISLSNSGASATLVSFQDGSAGTTLWTALVPAGGGSNIGSGMPMFKTSSGNALYFASGTSTSTLYVSAAGFSA